jgi:hypothetical protein
MGLVVVANLSHITRQSGLALIGIRMHDEVFDTDRQFDTEIFNNKPSFNCQYRFRYEELAEFLCCSTDTLRRTPCDLLVRHQVGNEVIFFWPDVMHYVRTYRRFGSISPINEKLLQEVEDDMLSSASDGELRRSTRRKP